MSKRLYFMAAPLVAAHLLMASAASPALAEDTPTADTVVATVNGTAITLGHMMLVRADLPAQYQQLPDDVLFQGILDQIVSQTLLEQSLTGEVPAAAEQLAVGGEHDDVDIHVGGRLDEHTRKLAMQILVGGIARFRTIERQRQHAIFQLGLDELIVAPGHFRFPSFCIELR